MPSIAAVVAQLAAAPRPVICLDTCDILEIIECLGWEGPHAMRNVECLKAAQRLLRELAIDPNRVQLVITELVAVEWNQNVVAVCRNAREFLNNLDAIMRRSHEAAAHVGIVLPEYAELAGSALVDDLTAVSLALLNQAIQLDSDDLATHLALQRVRAKRRPSHDGHVKDSIHFEHYLELARQFCAAGYSESCIFVSRNRRDFCEPQTSQIHSDLATEISDPSVRLRFFSSLHAALGSLGI